MSIAAALLATALLSLVVEAAKPLRSQGQSSRPRLAFARPGIPRINPHHPLSAGLAFLYPALPGYALDLVTGRTTTIKSNKTSTKYGPSAYGGQWSNTTDSNDFDISYTPITTSNGSGTGDFAIAGIMRPTTGAQNDEISSDKPTNFYFDLFSNYDQNGSASNGHFGLWTGNGTSSYIVATTGSQVDSNWHTVLGQRRGSGPTIEIYVDGLKPAQATGGTQSAYNVGGATHFKIGTVNAQGSIIALAIGWNRSLSVGEIAEWSADPFAMLLYYDDSVATTIANAGIAAGGGCGALLLRGVGC